MPPICTGFAIAPRVVLGDRHCWEGGSAIVIAVDNGFERMLRSERIVSHPDLDVMLIVLPESEPGLTSFLPILDGTSIGLTRGDVGLAAGYGEDENGTLGSLRFIAERVLEVGAEAIVTTADEAGGLCRGDSGAPLLFRDPSGSVGSVGILKGGARSCRGTELFLPLSAISNWILSQVDLPPTEPTCGTLSGEGRCFRGIATWCEGDIVRTAVCSDQTACGWDTRAAGYRCVGRKEATCQGADAYGLCIGTHVVRCRRERTEEIDCGTCGHRCVYTASGEAVCGG